MPLAYLITFHTYGTWLHGVAKGSVEPGRNRPGDPFVPEDPARLERDSTRLIGGSFVLSDAHRAVVAAAIRGVCAHRSWRVLALNVRSNHVHAVASGSQRVELMMNSFKSWATRTLRTEGMVEASRRVWARHGSTRWLHMARSVEAACDYVSRLQRSEAVVFRSARHRDRSDGFGTLPDGRVS